MAGIIARTVHLRGTRRALVFFATLASGCGDPGAGESIDETALALDVCGETVPANRFIDGIPAYAQCEATMNSSIWSNNGVDTSLTSLGPDWVQTQRSGGYQCTELTYRYMRFRWNVSYRSGNANEWCDGELPANLVKSTIPVHGDLIVFAGGVCGADASTGHIAVVDTVDAARSTVTIVEENRAGRRSTEQSCATCFLHATANDGSSAGAAGAGGLAGAGGSAMSAGSGGTAGAAGLGNGGSGDGGAEPATSGRAGSNAAGSPGLGGTGGQGAMTGGSTAAGGSGTASGGTGTSGASATSGTTGQPAGDGDALDAEAGCSISPLGSRGRGTPGLAAALVLMLGLSRSRKRRRAPAGSRCTSDTCRAAKSARAGRQGPGVERRGASCRRGNRA